MFLYVGPRVVRACRVWFCMLCHCLLSVGPRGDMSDGPLVLYVVPLVLYVTPSFLSVGPRLFVRWSTVSCSLVHVGGLSDSPLVLFVIPRQLVRWPTSGRFDASSVSSDTPRRFVRWSTPICLMIHRFCTLFHVILPVGPPCFCSLLHADLFDGPRPVLSDDPPVSPDMPCLLYVIPRHLFDGPRFSVRYATPRPPEGLCRMFLSVGPRHDRSRRSRRRFHTMVHANPSRFCTLLHRFCTLCHAADPLGLYVGPRHSLAFPHDGPRLIARFVR